MPLERFDAQLFAERPEGWRVKDRRARSILTEFGEVSFVRRIYTDEFGGSPDLPRRDSLTAAGQNASRPARSRRSPSSAPRSPTAGRLVRSFRHCREKVSAMTTMGGVA
ncbi:MAG: hypothetical protein AB2L09_13325 [Coriobacteriia bacterium]